MHDNNLRDTSVLRGRSHSRQPASPPVGFMHVPGTPRPEVIANPQTSKLVEELFYIAAHDPKSIRQLVHIMNARGLRSRSGKPLSPSTVYWILTDPFYYGIIRHQGDYIRGDHQTLISKALFDRVQQNLSERRRCERKSPLYSFSTYDQASRDTAMPI